MYSTMKTRSYAEKYRLRTPPKLSGRSGNNYQQKGLHTRTRSELLLNIQLQPTHSQASLQIKPSPPENAARKIIHKRALSDYVTQSKPVLNLKGMHSDLRTREESHPAHSDCPAFPMTSSAALRYYSADNLRTIRNSVLLGGVLPWRSSQQGTTNCPGA